MFQPQTIELLNKEVEVNEVQPNQFLYEDTFHINSDLVDSGSLKVMVHTLASLDIYNKYDLNAPIIKSLHIVVGADTTVHYSFLAGSEVQQLNRRYKEDTPKVELLTDKFRKEIMDSTKDKSKYLDLSKLSMTFREPGTDNIYFQTHTGKVYNRHFAIGEVPVKSKEAGHFVNIDCDHTFETVEQQTRSGDEEIRGTKVCVKCGADKKNLKVLPKIVPESVIDNGAKIIHRLVEGSFSYDEVHTLARIMSTFEEEKN